MDTERRVRLIKRIFPSKPPQQITVTQLSIADATVARFSTCGAIWFYDKADGFDANEPLVFKHLESALLETLSDYPHYAGQLQWATQQHVEGTNNPRYVGRPIVTYGSSDDPGVELVVVEDRRELSTLVPSVVERSTSKRIWDASSLCQSEFLPATKLAFSSLAEYIDLPAVAAQLTAFKCGGFAVSLKMAHCLSDATCLLQFIHCWAGLTQQRFNTNRTRTAQGTHTQSRALFNPRMLDAHANLSPNVTTPDAERIHRARSLPMHRFNWWATDAPGYPSWATASSNVTKPPPGDSSWTQLSPATDPPWPTWDLSAAVEHMQIHFTKAEVDRIKIAAIDTLPDDLQGQNVSRQDALLAHLWILINRARNLENLQDQVYLDISLGIRNRVSPPLPDSFVGSPLLLAFVAKTGVHATNATIGTIAGSIRQMLSRFTAQAVSDYLYEAAHEVSPQRIWQSFLGSRHVLVTSWARAQAYEVDFRGTGPARYVQTQMPLMDGLLQLMDVARTGDFDVSLALEKGAMERLLSDPMLRAYDKQR
ncbi:putative transferase family protein [Rosellinia necatrix]|uniref:Putative transferase family protein n=1 Tax=Rosellinia necatrix TaxID=77044 RepID=A0A1W2TTK8_ROSNE|nr:putative transferase family protein [Rosellinia necatrix]